MSKTLVALPVTGAGVVPGPCQVTSQAKFGWIAKQNAQAESPRKGKIALDNGGEPDFMMAASAATFDKISHMPAFYGARYTATVFHPGVEFATVALNGLKFTLQGDKNAGAMFVGKNYAWCTNTSWDMKSKGIQ